MAMAEFATLFFWQWPSCRALRPPMHSTAFGRTKSSASPIADAPPFSYKNLMRQTLVARS